MNTPKNLETGKGGVGNEEFEAELKRRVQFLRECANPTHELIAMRLTARPGEGPLGARVDFHILFAIAKHIGTGDPLAESNLEGICAKRDVFESILTEITERVFAS